MHETTGVLRPAIMAYLNHDEMTGEQIAAMRAYLRQWAAGPWVGPGVETLRADVDRLQTRDALVQWIELAVALGLDPL